MWKPVGEKLTQNSCHRLRIVSPEVTCRCHVTMVRYRSFQRRVCAHASKKIECRKQAFYLYMQLKVFAQHDSITRQRFVWIIILIEGNAGSSLFIGGLIIVPLWMTRSFCTPECVLIIVNLHRRCEPDLTNVCPYSTLNEPLSWKRLKEAAKHDKFLTRETGAK